jgi:hypothetical protein
MAPTSYPTTTSTPWGRADFATKHGRGVIEYSCPGHGGVHLSTTRNTSVHPAWRNADGWYEEDCEYAIVVLSFPELFPHDVVVSARSSAKDWFPHQYATITGLPVAVEESYVLRKEAFEAAHANDWVVTSASGSWADGVPEGFVGVHAQVGGRYTNNAGRRFLVPEAEYATRSQFGFVVDPAVHAVWSVVA